MGNEDKLIVSHCQKCGVRGFEKKDTDIPFDVPGSSPVLVKQEHFECTNCGEVYLTQNQSLEFAGKIENNQFRKLQA